MMLIFWLFLYTMVETVPLTVKKIYILRKYIMLQNTTVFCNVVNIYTEYIYRTLQNTTVSLSWLILPPNHTDL